MSSSKSELSEVDRKLQELQTFYKNAPFKSTISTIIDSFKAVDSEVPLKVALKNTLIPSQLSNLLDSKNTIIHIHIFELVYLCIVNDLYSISDISNMISNLAKHSWSQQYKLKILQMCFYFVRMDLQIDMFFKLMSLIIESFVIEDSNIDLITRPIVSQIIEKTLTLIKNENTENGLEYIKFLFQFLYDNIVYKKQYFLSYTFPIILKYPEIDRFQGFNEFISKDFIEISLSVLKKGKSEEKGPIFESILKIERFFSNISLDLLYKEISVDIIRCDFLLRFISHLIQIRSDRGSADCKKKECFEIHNNIKEILYKFIIETNFTSKNSDKRIRFFNEIILNMKTEMNLVRFIDTTFEKITESRTSAVDAFYLNCLKFCAENGIRPLFEKGLICGYKGKIKNMNNIVFDMKDYIKEFWSIFFQFNTKPNVNFERIKEFDLGHLEYFINSLPKGNKFSSTIFDESKHLLMDSMGLFEIFLEKIDESEVLLKIIIEYHSQNNSVDPRPLRILLSNVDMIKSIPKNVICDFMNDLIDLSNLELCWNEFFELLKYSDAPIKILIKIAQTEISDENRIFHKNKISEKNIKHVFEFLKDLLKNETNTFSENDVLLDVFKQYFKYLLRIDNKNPLFSVIWNESLNFISEKINTSEFSLISGSSLTPDASKLQTSFTFIEILFDALSINYKTIDHETIVFFNKIIFEKVYEIKNIDILKKSLEEMLKFLDIHLPRYDLEGLMMFLSDKLCDCNYASISQLSFENIKLILKNIKNVINETTMPRNEQKIVLKYKGKKKKNQKTINFVPNTTEQDNKKDLNSLMDKRVFHSSSNSSETHPLVSIIFKSFKLILENCDPVNSDIIFQVFLEIPSFVFNSEEIFELSEYLRKYIEMSEPFRTSALECFIKTCGMSQQFSFCLKILSSWLSKESRETSLSLIDKIKEKLIYETHNHGEETYKIAGLSYFLDYSLQFSQSDDFLEPVLDLVEECGCKLDIEMVKKLIKFSKRFILSQIEIKYNERREEKLKGYIQFLHKTVVFNNTRSSNEYVIDMKTIIDVFLDTLIQITRKRTYYMKLKMECFEILFELYEHSQSVLKDELKIVFNNLSNVYIKEGDGMSEYSIIELRIILSRLLHSNNLELIEHLKIELINLLLIRDSLIIDLIRLLLKKLFVNQK